MPRRPKTRTQPLNRERVLRAAVAYADRHGTEAITMRKLAEELGVEAMSLYNHVENKDDILGGIVELVTREIEIPPPGTEWKEAIRRHAISMRELALRHPWAGRLRISRRGEGHGRIDHAEWILKTLREAGLPNDVVYHAFHILEAYILGFTALHLSFPYKGKELSRRLTRFLAEFPTEDYPDLAEHIRGHMNPPQGEQGGFEIGLDLILDGFERLRGTA